MPTTMVRTTAILAFVLVIGLPAAQALEDTAGKHNSEQKQQEVLGMPNKVTQINLGGNLCYGRELARLVHGSAGTAVVPTRDTMLRQWNPKRLVGTAGYTEAYSKGWALMEQLPRDTPVSEELIAQVHRTIMAPCGENCSAGSYRRAPAFYLDTEFAPPGEVASQMSALVQDMNRLLEAVPAGQPGEALAARLMAQLLRVHPFADGNGRVSTLLGNWILLKRGLPSPVDFQATSVMHEQWMYALWSSDVVADLRPMTLHVLGAIFYALDRRGQQPGRPYATLTAEHPLSAQLGRTPCGSTPEAQLAMAGWKEPNRKGPGTPFVEVDITSALATVLFAMLKDPDGLARYMAVNDVVMGEGILLPQTDDAGPMDRVMLCKAELYNQKMPLERFSPLCEEFKELRTLLVEACDRIQGCPKLGFVMQADAMYLQMQAITREFLTTTMGLVESTDFLIYGDQIVLRDPPQAVADAASHAFHESFEAVMQPGGALRPEIEATRPSLEEGQSWETKLKFVHKYRRLRSVMSATDPTRERTMLSLVFEPAHPSAGRRTYGRRGLGSHGSYTLKTSKSQKSKKSKPKTDRIMAVGSWRVSTQSIGSTGAAALAGVCATFLAVLIVVKRRRDANAAAAAESTRLLTSVPAILA